MSVGIQCCVRCGVLEEGGTGPGNKYVCTECWKEGWRVDGFGNIRLHAAHANIPAHPKAQ